MENAGPEKPETLPASLSVIYLKMRTLASIFNSISQTRSLPV